MKAIGMLLKHLLEHSEHLALRRLQGHWLGRYGGGFFGRFDRVEELQSKTAPLGCS
jgi:hypothetical protein